MRPFITDWAKGVPFTLSDPDRICIGIESDDDENIKYCYTLTSDVGKDEYRVDTMPGPLDVNSNQQIFSYIPMYAKILQIGYSSDVFGNFSRNKEFLGSVLRAVDFGIAKDKIPYLLLQTGRPDGTILKIVTSELKLILPNITVNSKKKTIKLERNDSVIAIKSEPCGLFSAGEEFLIKSITKNNASRAMDILSLENKKDKIRIVAYAKFFKKQ